jgi:hypothetical protein
MDKHAAVEFASRSFHHSTCVGLVESLDLIVSPHSNLPILSPPYALSKKKLVWVLSQLSLRKVNLS